MTTGTKTFLWIAGIIGAGLAGTGLFIYEKQQIAAAMNYCYKIKAYRLNKMTLSKISLSVDILIRNKSNFDLDIEGYDMTVYLNGTKLATIKSTKTQKITNNSLSQITVDVDVSPKGLFRNLTDIANIALLATTDKSKVIIKVDGIISAASSGIRAKDLPVTMSMTLAEITADDPNAEICTVV